jgi:choline/glycine/proline betaine transport protein
MFIARISRGRTIREFVLGVLLVPTALTTVWMTVFGNTGFWLDENEAGGALAAAVEANIDTALFEFLGYFPLTTVTSVLAIILISVFFITSADSGSLVLDTIASGGADETPALQRVFWTFLLAAVASVLLVAGGLTALQTAMTASALPFVIVMLVMVLGLARGLAADQAGRVLLRQRQAGPKLAGGGTMPWRQRLTGLIQPPSEEAVKRFIDTTVKQAMENVAAEIEKEGYVARVEESDGEVRLVVPSEEARDFVYGVRPRCEALPGFILPEVTEKGTAQNQIWMATTHFFDGRRGYTIAGLSKDPVITDILDQFEMYRQIARAPETALYVTSPDIVPEPEER